MRDSIKDGLKIDERDGIQGARMDQGKAKAWRIGIRISVL